MLKIVIYLGSNCNLNCKYCHREKTIEYDVSNELIEYLSNRECIVEFKGGEPTLYMKAIKKIVSIANKAKFKITTNGVLLDKYIEYFKENNFHITISYDGNNNVRSYNPLTKPLHYDNVSISTTLSHNNCDIEKILDDFTDRSLVINKWLYFYFHLAHYTTKSNEMYALTDDDYKNVLFQIKNGLNIYKEDIEKYHTINMRYRSLYLGLLRQLNNNYIYGETFCANSNTKRIDLTNQQYNCLYIRDTKLDDDWLKYQQSLISNKYPKCIKCNVYNMCGAGCIKSIYHNKECTFYFSLYNWFKEWYYNNKEVLDSVEN